MSAWSLETLIDPNGVDEFFSRYFESERLLVRRNRPDYFNDLLTYDDVDRILTTREPMRGEVSLTTAQKKFSASEYVLGDNTINVDQLFRHHDDGATIILNRLQRRHQPLTELTAALELEFSARVQANVYITPPGNQGFNPHFDTHDVIVLQLAGSKRWQLYGTPIELTLKGHGDLARQREPGEVSEEFDLRAGDTLYVPRGLVHEAISTDETSMHITVGVLSWTWFDFLVEAVESLAAEDKDVRAALPRRFARGDVDAEGFKKTFADLAGRLASVDPEEVRLGFADRFIDRRRPFLRNQLRALSDVKRLSLNSLVGCRPLLSYRIEEDDETVRLRFHRREINLPAYAAAVLRFALETPRFTVGELPDGLDDEGKVVLVRRLIREGLLQLFEI
ncbi:MAG: cupin domain-containing protein [Methyloceanibacter sp.]|nr:cupin domain-containing protein [Methyloceanibacter sp.]